MEGVPHNRVLVRIFTKSGNVPFKRRDVHAPSLRGSLPHAARARPARSARARRAAAAAVVAVLVVVALAPGAMGDHTYSHRYLVRGRVLDEAGNPLVNATMALGTEGFRAESLCSDSTPPYGRTDEFGDFEYCMHVHEIPAGANVTVALGDYGYPARADGDLRVTTFLLEVKNATGSPKPLNWARTYVVEGKVWQRTREGTQDNVRVTGVALPDEEVTLTLETGGLSFDGQATTDGYGEYRVRFHLPVDVRDGNVTVGAAGEERTFPLIPKFMRSRIDVKLDGDGDHPLLDEQAPPRLNFPEQPPADVEAAPGTAVPPLPMPSLATMSIVATAGAVLLGGAWVALTLKERRFAQKKE